MVNDTTSELLANAPTSVLDDEQAKLEAAYKQAMAQYVEAEKVAAAQSATVVDDGKPYSRHEAAGIGTYVIPRRTGWNYLLDIIHDPVPNIDFSANIYPNFDGIIGQRYQSPYLLDPLDSHYESYESLRDNLAAVRNFLLERYYAVDSTMDSGKAREALAEIASFVGDGLYNNMVIGHLIKTHDPDKPFIDMSRAREKNGEGAQYIYECILAHNRNAGGFRPLEALKQMFGGKKPADWNLPDADKTHFTETFHHDLAPTEVSADPDRAATNAAIAAAVANVDAIQARMAAVRDAKTLSNAANGLDNVGNYLVYTAGQTDGIAHLDEPTRRNAVDIARDILKGLKIFGSKDATQRLNLMPSEDAAVFGSLKSVAKVYGHLLAWARSSGDVSILQNPAVLAATQAIAQMGYLAKREALSLAEKAGNAVLAHSITEQLKLLPAAYIPKPGTRFGDLLDTVQSGMDTILNRTQQVVVDGGQIGHSRDGEHGGAMNTIPTAGIGNQVGVNEAAQRNMQAMMAADLAAQAQAQQLNAQAAAQARKQGQAAQQPVQARSTTGRQTLGAAQQAKRQAAIVAPSRVSPTAPLNVSQQQAALRANTSAGLAARRASSHHHEEEEHEAQLRLQAQQRAAAALAANKAAKAAATKLDPNMLKAFSMKGVTGAPITSGRDISPQGVLAKRPATPGIAPQTVRTAPVDTNRVPDTRHPDELQPMPQPVPPNRGGGRGF